MLQHVDVLVGTNWYVEYITGSQRIAGDAKALEDAGIEFTIKRNMLKVQTDMTIEFYPQVALKGVYSSTQPQPRRYKRAYCDWIEGSPTEWDSATCTLNNFYQVDRHYKPNGAICWYRKDNGQDSSMVGAATGDGERNPAPNREFVRKNVAMWAAA